MDRTEQKEKTMLGSGCGSVGRAVASDTKSLQFKNSHWQTFILNINCHLLLGCLNSRVVFTLDYNEHRYTAPWAVRSILRDNHSFSAKG